MSSICLPLRELWAKKVLCMNRINNQRCIKVISEYNYSVVELLKAIYGEKAAHRQAVIDQQFDKTDAVHHQRIQHGLFQGPHLHKEHFCDYSQNDEEQQIIAAQLGQSHRPVLPVHQDVFLCDVSPVPSQSHTQLLGWTSPRSCFCLLIIITIIITPLLD